MKTGPVIMTIVIMMFFLSCRKQITVIRTIPSPTYALTDTEQLRAHISKEVASILEIVYRQPDAYYEVNAAIYASYYEDERVLLMDLLFPEESALYKSAGFKRLKSREGVFSKEFRSAFNKGNYPYLKTQGFGAPSKSVRVSSVDVGTIQKNNNPQIPLLSGNMGLAIYFPYSENFTAQFAGMYKDASGNFLKRSLATIVATDRESDEGTGREPYDCGMRLGTPICFRNVRVNDDYAAVHATHIVAIGAEPKAPLAKDPEVAPAMYRVYNGSSKLTRQLDRLISIKGNGGGSEIKMGRISGYLSLKDQQVTGFDGNLVTAYFKRGDIRNQQWMRIFSVWDPNWETGDKEQTYAVYEEDTEGTSKFRGSLTTTITLPGKPSTGKVVGEIGFDVSVRTQDEIITQRSQDRDSYFSDALNDQGWAYIKDSHDFLSANKDWPIFDGGAIWQYTWPYRLN